MNKWKTVSMISIICTVIAIIALSVILFFPETTSATVSPEKNPMASEGVSNQFLEPVTPTASIQDINNTVVALVMQPGQDKLYAYSALTGEWATLGGPNFKVDKDDIAMSSNIAILVSQPGQEKLHAYSALTGKWATLDGPDIRVDKDDIIKVHDSVIIVSQPGQEKLHAYSALTGEWTTISGADIRVAPDDIILVGAEN